MLALFHHDPNTAPTPAWVGANLVAVTAVKLDALVTSLLKWRPKK